MLLGQLRARRRPRLGMTWQGPRSFLGATSGVPDPGSLRLATFPREGRRFPVSELKFRPSVFRGNPSRRLSVQRGLRILLFRRATSIPFWYLLSGASHPPLSNCVFSDHKPFIWPMCRGGGITHLCGLMRVQSPKYSLGKVLALCSTQLSVSLAPPCLVANPCSRSVLRLSDRSALLNYPQSVFLPT